MRARIFSSDMREKMRGTHMSKFHAPTPLHNLVPPPGIKQSKVKSTKSVTNVA